MLGKPAQVRLKVQEIDFASFFGVLRWGCSSLSRFLIPENLLDAPVDFVVDLVRLELRAHDADENIGLQLLGFAPQALHLGVGFRQGAFSRQTSPSGSAIQECPNFR